MKHVYLINYKAFYSEFDLTDLGQKLLYLDEPLTPERFFKERELIKQEIDETLDEGFIKRVKITYIYKFED